jgi:4-amino-4-deoxy-L-arabinose transferase-like glycosyltransferase
MTFLGDEGRDALVWLHMLRNGKFTLIGPQTSIGNMYLGPLFYYLMFPFYLLFGTPGPSIGTAIFAGMTTFLLWYAGKEWFSEKAGLSAAFLYAVSPVTIVLSLYLLY